MKLISGKISQRTTDIHRVLCGGLLSRSPKTGLHRWRWIGGRCWSEDLKSILQFTSGPDPDWICVPTFQTTKRRYVKRLYLCRQIDVWIKLLKRHLQFILFYYSVIWKSRTSFYVYGQTCMHQLCLGPLICERCFFFTKAL